MKLGTVLVVMVATALLTCGLFASVDARTTSTVPLVTSSLQSLQVADVNQRPTPTCWPGDKRCWPEGHIVETSVNQRPTPTCWPGDKRCWPEGHIVETSVNQRPTPTCWPGDKRCWPEGHIA